MIIPAGESKRLVAVMRVVRSMVQGPLALLWEVVSMYPHFLADH